MIWVSGGLFIATLYVFLTRGGYSSTLEWFTAKGFVLGTSQQQLAEEAAEEVEKTPQPPSSRHAIAQLQTFITDMPVEHVPTWDPLDPDPAPAQAPSYIQRPASSSPTAPKRRRLIIIGDVHGQLDALRTILRKIDFDQGSGDHLVTWSTRAQTATVWCSWPWT
jgi:chemotaxis response regulator CheB